MRLSGCPDNKTKKRGREGSSKPCCYHIQYSRRSCKAGSDRFIAHWWRANFHLLAPWQGKAGKTSWCPFRGRPRKSAHIYQGISWLGRRPASSHGRGSTSGFFGQLVPINRAGQSLQGTACCYLRSREDWVPHWCIKSGTDNQGIPGKQSSIIQRSWLENWTSHPTWT